MGLIAGVGIADTKSTVNGRIRKEYSTWRNMLLRCYKTRSGAEARAYGNVSVCEEWKVLSGFERWLSSDSNMEKVLSGWHLDKDLLVVGNKEYSPKGCVMIPQNINKFLTFATAKRGKYLVGVNLHKRTGRLTAQVQNQITRKKEHLGLFDCEKKAHLAWKNRKIELLNELFDSGHFDEINQRERVFGNAKAIIEGVL